VICRTQDVSHSCAQCRFAAAGFDIIYILGIWKAMRAINRLISIYTSSATPTNGSTTLQAKGQCNMPSTHLTRNAHSPSTRNRTRSSAPSRTRADAPTCPPARGRRGSLVCARRWSRLARRAPTSHAHAGSFPPHRPPPTRERASGVEMRGRAMEGLSGGRKLARGERGGLRLQRKGPGRFRRLCKNLPAL
jgi:hypothetical protein